MLAPNKVLFIQIKHMLVVFAQVYMQVRHFLSKANSLPISFAITSPLI